MTEEGDSGGRADYGVVLGPLASWDYGAWMSQSGATHGIKTSCEACAFVFFYEQNIVYTGI
jgi:hypothetical protein